MSRRATGAILLGMQVREDPEGTQASVNQPRRFGVLVSAAWVAGLLAGCAPPITATGTGGVGGKTSGGGGFTGGGGGTGGGRGATSGGSGGNGTNGGNGGSTVGATGGISGTGGRATGTGGRTGSTGGTIGGTGGASLGTGGTIGVGGTSGACSSALSSRVRITEIDVGVSYAYNEVDNNGLTLGLTPLAISALPGGGARLAFLGRGDSLVHIVTLDAADQVVAGSAFTLPAYDFQDIYADAAGGVLLVSRAALGSTLNNNCGNINNLCGLVASYPTGASCYDMYMVRFDGTTETWATKLTDTTAALPGYGTAATSGGSVVFIWSPYAHNGRIAFDGTNYAGYFGAAITVPNQSCCGTTPAPCRTVSALDMGVNIHQGDRMKAVNGSGVPQATGFSFGCSHSGYERVVWDPTARAFITVCHNDAPTAGKSGRLAFAPATTTIYPDDNAYSDLGSVILAGGGGYWLISSDIRVGQPANANGLADVHLQHVVSVGTPTPDRDIMLVSDGRNDRAPHLSEYGSTQLLAAWESATATGTLGQNAAGRQMYLQILDRTTGAAPAGSSTTSAGPLALTPNVLGSRYQDFRPLSDGSVAYPAPGTTATKIKILRVLPCAP